MMPVLRAEWTKVKTVRSTFATLLAAFVVTVALSAVVCLASKAQWARMSATQRASFDPTSTSFIGVFLGQLALIAFAVTVIGNEYTTGMIRVTLAAVPRRGRLLAAKATIVTATVLPVALQPALPPSSSAKPCSAATKPIWATPACCAPCSARRCT